MEIGDLVTYYGVPIAVSTAIDSNSILTLDKLNEVVESLDFDDENPLYLTVSSNVHDELMDCLMEDQILKSPYKFKKQYQTELQILDESL